MAPSAEETLIQSRHPLHLPLALIERLQAQTILPPTLVHNPGKPDARGDERRKFFFVPDRLDERQLAGLGEVIGSVEGWGGELGEERWQEGEGAGWLKGKYGGGGDRSG